MPAVPGVSEVLGSASAEVMSNEPALIRIMSVDDHPLLRSGIAALVANVPDMRVVAEAANGREALIQFRAHRPDITLMDLEMPEMNGLDALIEIRREAPGARVIVLTTYSGDAQALRALRAGACAYLLKDTIHKDLRDTIRAVHAGRKSISPEVSFHIAEHATDDALTEVEVRVLGLISEGNANKEIAALLSVTEDTVKGHVRNIMSKLGAKDRTHATTIGLKRGIIGL
jgi:DNA-binding NarL/FixJ family response regulator